MYYKRQHEVICVISKKGGHHKFALFYSYALLRLGKIYNLSIIYIQQSGVIAVYLSYNTTEISYINIPMI